MAVEVAVAEPKQGDEEAKKKPAKYVEEPEPEPFVETPAYSAWASYVVLLNALVIGLETDLGCFSCPERATWWGIFDIVLLLMFIGDIASRIVSYTIVAILKGESPVNGVLFYFRGDRLVNQMLVTIHVLKNKEPLVVDVGCEWLNIFDLVLVFCRILDFGVPGMKVVSMLRLFHLGLFVKRARLVRAFRELWLIISGLGGTLKTILWVGILLVLLMWIVAVLLTVTVGQKEGADSEVDYGKSEFTLDEYWGTVPRSLFSLFQIATLDQWSSALVKPLVWAYPISGIFFLLFLCLSVLSLLNLIVGVIVESTLSAAKANDEAEAKELVKVRAKVTESLHAIFKDADVDGNGELSRGELDGALLQKRIRDRMRLLGVPKRDLHILFDQLVDALGPRGEDRDNPEGKKSADEATVPTDIFFQCCTRLTGNAMSADLYQMTVDFDRDLKWTSDIFDRMTATNDMLGRLLDDIDLMDRNVVKGDEDHKDPVLVARRSRKYRPKSKVLRGQWKELDEEEHDAPKVDPRLGSKASVEEEKKDRLDRGGRHPSVMRASLRVAAREMDDHVKGIWAPPPPMPPGRSPQGGSEPRGGE